MKSRKLALMLVAIMIVSFGVGCSSSTNDNKDTQKKDDAVEQVEESKGDDKPEVNKNQKEDNTFSIGEKLTFEDFNITIKGFSLGKDYDGKDAVIVDYSWENTSEDSIAPFLSFSLRAYQDNVETEDVFMVENVDLARGQRDVKPGGVIEDGQTAIGLDTMDKPLEVEVSKLISFSKEHYSITINPSELK